MSTMPRIELIYALREELKRYLAAVAAGPLTDEEKKDLGEWVASGHSVYDNPYFLYDESGCPMSFIEGCRFAEELWEGHDSHSGEGANGTDDECYDVEDEDIPFRQ
jgi:hypothetical protein